MATPYSAAGPTATAASFNAAALNLAPQQPPRVRRAWERVPTKAKAARSATALPRDRKDRTVWKRAEPKPAPTAAKDGGMGFAAHGSKRLRMKNTPAFPVSSGHGVEREQEAEATDDELFSRRRKSARRSSINPLRKLLSPKKEATMQPPRKPRTGVNPHRAPLRNRRVMELNGSPQAAVKRTRPSIGGVLGNGTPMRNAFAEPTWAARSPTRLHHPSMQNNAAVPPNDDSQVSPQKSLFQSTTLSPLKAPSPQKHVPPTFSPSPRKPFSTSEVFGAQRDCQFHLSPSIFRMTPTELSTAVPGTTKFQIDSPAKPQPRRRSARLSAQYDSLLEKVEPEADSTPDTSQRQPLEPERSTSPAAAEVLNEIIVVKPSDTAPVSSPRADSIVLSESQEANKASAQQLADELALTVIDEDMKIDCEAIVLMDSSHCSEPKPEPEVKAEETEAILGVTGEVLKEERDSSPQKDATMTLEFKSTSVGPVLQQPERLCESPKKADTTEAPFSDRENLENEEEEVSDDELTTRLDHWTDPALSCDMSESARPRNAPRLSDDTTILKDFLNRAHAKRAAQALATSSGSPAKKSSPRKSPVRKEPIRASPARASPRRSPRRALESVDGNSPSPPKLEAKIRLGTPPSKRSVFLDADESDELASPVKTTRRSARAKPVVGRQGAGGPSLIPLRRTDGQEPPRLRKTEAQELAIVTRTNTRRNKGQARLVPEVLHDLSHREMSPVKERAPKKSRKSVDWNTELVSYLGEHADVQVQAKEKAKTKRTQGLGTVNGTPARPRATAAATTAALLPSSVRAVVKPGVNNKPAPAASGGSLALASSDAITVASVRPRPRRAQGA